MESIEALLAALKNHESGKADMSQVIPLGSKMSVTKIPLGSLDSGHDDAASSPDDPSEGKDDPDEQGDAAQNAKIVDALQTQFPKTYAKIMADISSSDDGQSDDTPPLNASSMVG